MIEVGQDGLGAWAWTMISAAGRILAYRDGFCCQRTAWEDAKAYRARLFGCGFDHRLGACL